jgi:hypothetical protein
MPAVLDVAGSEQNPCSVACDQPGCFVTGQNVRLDKLSCILYSMASGGVAALPFPRPAD